MMALLAEAGAAFFLFALGVAVLVSVPSLRASLRRRDELTEAHHRLEISYLRAAENRQLDTQLALVKGDDA